MTFLLFLASLGVLHYVLRKSAETASESHHPAAPESAAEPVATPGLLALGRALEQHGRGRAPQPAAAETLQELRVKSPSEP
ncbi:MAG: hypothetical protein LAQ30_23120 [Acidobacteriia bacterium]|nr:hypothetical protein [Terriglobia bacterium]